MNYRSVFEKRLNETIIPEGTPKPQLENWCNQLDEIVVYNLKNELYKYRCCCENHIEAFYNDQIWLSRADKFNDGYDTRIYYDKKTIGGWLNSNSPERILKSVKNTVEKDIKLPEQI